MIRKMLAAALVAVVALAQTAVAAPAAPNKRAQQTPFDARAKVDRAGLGEKARITVWLRDGRKIKGYVAERREADFVVRDRRTDAPTILQYADVTKLDINRGHSTARNVTLGAVIGVATFFTLIAVTIAAND